jgi:hypothetical protein
MLLITGTLFGFVAVISVALEATWAALLFGVVAFWLINLNLLRIDGHL